MNQSDTSANNNISRIFAKVIVDYGSDTTHTKYTRDSPIPRDHHQYIMFTHSVPKTIFICSTTWATHAVVYAAK